MWDLGAGGVFGYHRWGGWARLSALGRVGKVARKEGVTDRVSGGEGDLRVG